MIFNEIDLIHLFRHVKIRPELLKKVKRPKEAAPWYHYRALFITDRRAQQGLEFWNTHAKTLAFAQRKYGVPASVIVAIIGVETQYGQTKVNIALSIHYLPLHLTIHHARNFSVTNWNNFYC